MADSRTEYRLNALEGFSCLGTDCPASCCNVGWDISVDADVEARWAAVPDATERARLLGAVRHIERDGASLHLMATDENRHCQLLTPSGLCSAQARHGSDYLPETCRLYPRQHGSAQTVELSSAALSCPEIAQRVLFPPGHEAVFLKRPPPNRPAWSGDAFIQSALTELLDRVMAENKFPLAARLYYLSDLLVRMAIASQRHSLDTASLASEPARCRQALYDINVRIKEKRLRPDPVQAGLFWQALYVLGRNRGILNFDHPALPTDAAGGDSLQRAVYAEILRWRASAKPQLHVLNEPLSRVLHAALINCGFAWQPAAGNYIASFMHAVLPFSLITLRLWLLAAANHDITETDVVESVYLTERALRHSQQIYTLLDAHPELLRLDLYHQCLVDL